MSRFRVHKALSANILKILKMHRQVILDTEDENIQRLLSNESLSPPLEHYRMTCNAYGLTSAGFHAKQPFLQLAETTKHAAASMYVENLLTGASPGMEP